MRFAPAIAVTALLALPVSAAGHAGDGVYVLARGFEAPNDAALLRDGSLVVAEGGSVTLIEPRGARRAVRGFDAWGVEPAADGSVLGIDPGSAVVRRWAPGRSPVVVAGRADRFGFAGDGGTATRALLNPQGIHWASGVQPLANGGFRFADTGNDRIREVDPSGVIRTVAAGLDAPLTLDPLPGGSWVVSQAESRDLLALRPDGRVETFARAAGPVSKAVATLPDGTVLWSETGRGGLSRLDPGMRRPRSYLRQTPQRPLDFAARGMSAIGLGTDGRGGVLITDFGLIWYVPNGPTSRDLIALRDVRRRARRVEAVVETTNGGKVTFEVLRDDRVFARLRADVAPGHSRLSVPAALESRWYRVRVQFGRSRDVVPVYGGRALGVRAARRMLRRTTGRTEEGDRWYVGRRCRRFGTRRIDCVIGFREAIFGRRDRRRCDHIGSLSLQTSGVVLARGYRCGNRRGRFLPHPRWSTAEGVTSLGP